MNMHAAKLVPTAKKGKDMDVKKVERTQLTMGCYVEQIADCSARNVCGLVGIDQYLLKSGHRQFDLSQSIGTDKEDKHKVDDLYRDIVCGEDSFRSLHDRSSPATSPGTKKRRRRGRA